MKTAPLTAASGFLARRDIVRWGIIGCGDVTEVKSGPGFQKAERSRLVAVMRRNGEKAADYARRHGVPRWYDDARALIADPEVDAVYVATPPDTHAHYAVEVAQAGKPVYVEKPMARHGPECDRMIAAAATARVPLFVAYYRRSMPRFRLVERVLAEGRIGAITGLTYRFAAPFHAGPAQWRVDAATAGGGHFLDLGSHVLDLIDFLTGPMADVHGTAANVASAYVVEDAVAMSFRTAAGAPATAAWNFAGGPAEDELAITGTRGRVSFSVFGFEPVRLATAEGIQSLDAERPAHVQQPMIQDVVDDLLGLRPSPSTGLSARRTSAVMDRVLQGYYGDRSGAFWETPERWPGRPLTS
jgi:predicted dehydrogenase